MIRKYQAPNNEKITMSKIFCGLRSAVQNTQQSPLHIESTTSRPLALKSDDSATSCQSPGLNSTSTHASVEYVPSHAFGSIANSKRPDLLLASSFCFRLLETHNPCPIAKYSSLVALLMPILRTSRPGKRVAHREEVLLIEESRRE